MPGVRTRSWLPPVSDQVLNRKVFFAVLEILLGALVVGVVVDGIRLFFVKLMRLNMPVRPSPETLVKAQPSTDITDRVIGVLVQRTSSELIRQSPSLMRPQIGKARCAGREE